MKSKCHQLIDANATLNRKIPQQNRHFLFIIRSLLTIHWILLIGNETPRVPRVQPGTVFVHNTFPFPLHSLSAEQSFARYSTVMESLSFWTQSYIVGSSPSWIRRWVSPPILLLLPLFLHSDPPLNVVLSLPHHSFYFSMISHLFNPPRPPLPIPKCNFRFFFFILHVKVLLSPVLRRCYCRPSTWQSQEHYLRIHWLISIFRISIH